MNRDDSEMRDPEMRSDMRDDPERHDDEMREVEMRTTPGRDPHMEEMTHEPAAPAGADAHPAGRAGEDGYRARFEEAQARFIDDPRGAVEEARSVLEEAVDRFMASIRSEMDASHDTEAMRRAMQRCRDILERLPERGR